MNAQLNMADDRMITQLGLKHLFGLLGVISNTYRKAEWVNEKVNSINF